MKFFIASEHRLLNFVEGNSNNPESQPPPIKQPEVQEAAEAADVSADNPVETVPNDKADTASKAEALPYRGEAKIAPEIVEKVERASKFKEDLSNRLQTLPYQDVTIRVDQTTGLMIFTGKTEQITALQQHAEGRNMQEFLNTAGELVVNIDSFNKMQGYLGPIKEGEVLTPPDTGPDSPYVAKLVTGSTESSNKPTEKTDTPATTPDAPTTEAPALATDPVPLVTEPGLQSVVTAATAAGAEATAEEPTTAAPEQVATEPATPNGLEKITDKLTNKDSAEAEATAELTPERIAELQEFATDLQGKLDTIPAYKGVTIALNEQNGTFTFTAKNPEQLASISKHAAKRNMNPESASDTTLIVTIDRFDKNNGYLGTSLDSKEANETLPNDLQVVADATNELQKNDAEHAKPATESAPDVPSDDLFDAPDTESDSPNESTETNEAEKKAPVAGETPLEAQVHNELREHVAKEEGNTIDTYKAEKETQKEVALERRNSRIQALENTNNDYAKDLEKFTTNKAALEAKLKEETDPETQADLKKDIVIATEDIEKATSRIADNKAEMQEEEQIIAEINADFAAESAAIEAIETKADAFKEAQEGLLETIKETLQKVNNPDLAQLFNGMTFEKTADLDIDLHITQAAIDSLAILSKKAGLVPLELTEGKVPDTEALYTHIIKVLNDLSKLEEKETEPIDSEDPFAVEKPQEKVVITKPEPTTLVSDNEQPLSPEAEVISDLEQVDTVKNDFRQTLDKISSMALRFSQTPDNPTSEFIRAINKDITAAERYKESNSALTYANALAPVIEKYNTYAKVHGLDTYDTTALDAIITQPTTPATDTELA